VDCWRDTGGGPIWTGTGISKKDGKGKEIREITFREIKRAERTQGRKIQGRLDNEGPWNKLGRERKLANYLREKGGKFKQRGKIQGRPYMDGPWKPI